MKQAWGQVVGVGKNSAGREMASRTRSRVNFGFRPSDPQFTQVRVSLYGTGRATRNRCGEGIGWMGDGRAGERSGLGKSDVTPVKVSEQCMSRKDIFRCGQDLRAT